MSLLIDAYFLRGDYRHIEQTKVLGSLVKRPVSGVDDVLEILGQVYRDANSPFPFIGNIKALSNGLVVPNVGDCFFWFIVSNDSDTIILGCHETEVVRCLQTIPVLLNPAIPACKDTTNNLLVIQLIECLTLHDITQP